jgi:hypothetical protein
MTLLRSLMKCCNSCGSSLIPAGIIISGLKDSQDHGRFAAKREGYFAVDVKGVKSCSLSRLRNYG